MDDRDRHGRDCMVVGFTTTCAISAYHHWCYEFESRSGRGVQHYVIQFVSDLRQVGGFHRFPPPMKNWPPRYYWNIVKSGVKHHQANIQTHKQNQWVTCSQEISISYFLNTYHYPFRSSISGVTTILSTAATGMMVRDGLPRVPYATALDVYLNVCIVYNLAAMIEYAAVNYFTKIIPKEGSASDNEEEQVIQRIILHNHILT